MAKNSTRASASKFGGESLKVVLVCFAGPRVIEQTIRQKLPKGFQTSEFVKHHGFIDRIVPRKQLKENVVSLISLLKG